MAGSFYPVPYAEMHDQAFAHCQIFFTAAANADGPCFSPTVAFPPVRKTMDLWLGILYNPNYLIQTEISVWSSYEALLLWHSTEQLPIINFGYYAPVRLLIL